MSGDPIIYFDRYEKALKEEIVYGDGALRFAYETAAGRVLAKALFSRAFVSRIFGWYMRRPASRGRIAPFVRDYGLDPDDFAQPLEAYGSFNDFFRRELKPEARPIDEDPGSTVFPADGRHLGWESIGTEQQVFVKGQKWDLEQLLGGDGELVSRFTGGTLVLSRLCPVDYHHFHYPVGGQLAGKRLIEGPLYSVSPVALRRRLAYMWENRRCLQVIDAGDRGQVVFIAVGATNVGSIRYRPVSEGGKVRKGQGNGWFEFGGSSVITIFEPGKVALAADLVQSTDKGVELYARMGDRMGSFRNY
jgi:phosphatidylserine decarboxylase